MLVIQYLALFANNQQLDLVAKSSLVVIPKILSDDLPQIAHKINTKLRQKVDNFLNNGIQYRANTVDKFEDFKQIFDKSPSLRFIKRKWAVSNCM